MTINETGAVQDHYCLKMKATTKERKNLNNDTKAVFSYLLWSGAQ